MKTFKITIYDDFFAKEFSGEFSAKTQKQAVKQCKEFYAQELDTDPVEINIIEVKEVN